MRAALVDTVTRTLADARDGRPRTLAITGPRGMGKSWVIDAAGATARDAGMTVLAARGRPGDSEWVFGALQALLRPVASRLDELVAEHAADLRAALSLQATGADCLAVRIGVFRLLCALSEESPLCLLLDDADLMDGATIDVISFALGRFGVDPVAAIATGRTDAGLAGATPVVLDAWPAGELAELLAERDLQASVAAACAEAARGNPGMAIALADGLSVGQRSGDDPLPPLLRPDAALLAHQQAQLATFDERIQRALVVVAADDAGEIRAVRSALRLLEEPAAESLERAEGEGLIEIDGPRVRFVDPWLRPAAYYLVAPASRRAAHRALAESYAEPHQAASRAWHLAAAADGPSDRVAEALALVAGDAARRGGAASAAATFSRAADFAETQPVRERAQVAALEQFVEALDLDAALRLARRMQPSTLDATVAVADVYELCGVRPSPVAMPDPTGDGPWALHRAERVARDRAARAGLHEDATWTPGLPFAADAQLAMAIAHRHAGRLGAAREALAVVEALVQPSCRLLMTRATLLGADLDLLTGRLDECQAQLATVDRQLAGSLFDWLQGRLDAARATSAGGAPSPWLLTSAVDVAAPPLSAIRADVATGCAERDPAKLAAAADAADHWQLPIEAGEAALARAEALAARHDPAAADAARSAAARLWRHGVHCWDARVAAVDVPGQPPAPAGDPALAQLSQAEMRVAEAVSAGMTNREAAAALFLSVKTIDFHLQQIYRKLAVRSRTELAVKVAGRGQTGMERVG